MRFGSEGKQYLVSGSMAISNFRYMFVTLYNKRMFSDVGLTDPYDVTKNGDWTLDYQASIISNLYRDDGNGNADEGDNSGLSAAARSASTRIGWPPAAA
jgi:hypothetical protein